MNVKRTTVLVLTAIFTALMYQAPISAQMLSSPQPQAFVPPSVFTLTITDTDGAPIEGARVLIGEAENSPFDGNVQVSDQDGHIAIPQNWLMPEPVTIEAPGFVRATYLDLLPSITTLKVRRMTGTKTSATRLELQGETSGFGQLKNDGIFDIGLVVPALPRAELSSMNLQSIISPEADHISVFGQNVDLPSNVTLPDQTESYIFPLHFDKSDYRLYLPAPGTWNIAALHARVPFKATVDALRNGKAFTEIINTFDFVGGSTTTLSLSQASTEQDLTVNQTKFNKSIKFTAPAFDKGLSLLAIAMSPKNNAFYPTDIKNVAPSKSVQLWAPSGAQADGLVLAAFQRTGAPTKGPAADQFSVVALPNNEQRPVDPIRLVNPPRINQNQLVLDTPTAPADLNPVMTYGLLSIVTLSSKGTLELETKEALWDVWAPTWVTTLDLPAQQLPSIDPATQSLRWEVGFHAQFSGQKSLPPGPDELEKITHVSRSSVTLE